MLGVMPLKVATAPTLYFHLLPVQAVAAVALTLHPLLLVQVVGPAVGHGVIFLTLAALAPLDKVVLVAAREVASVVVAAAVRLLWGKMVKEVV